MDRQDVTFSLPKDLLADARQLAVNRGVSLSRLVAAYLEEMVRRESGYEQAKQRAVARMRRGIPMGLGGRPTWTREDLYER